MKSVLKFTSLLVATFVLASPVTAQPVTDRESREQLFERLGTGYTLYEIYSNPRRGGPGQAVLHLKLDALRESPAKMADTLAVVRALGLSDGYLELITEVIQWRRELDERNPDEIYELSKKYVTQGAHNTGEILADTLVRLAASRGSNRARFDIGIANADGRNGWRSMTGLKRLADDGYLPAQMEMARRHTQGDGTSHDPMRALYWLMRADRNGGTVADLLAQVREGATAKDIEEALDRIRSGRAPTSFSKD